MVQAADCAPRNHTADADFSTCGDEATVTVVGSAVWTPEEPIVVAGCSYASYVIFACQENAAHSADASMAFCTAAAGSTGASAFSLREVCESTSTTCEALVDEKIDGQIAHSCDEFCLSTGLKCSDSWEYAAAAGTSATCANKTPHDKARMTSEDSCATPRSTQICKCHKADPDAFISWSQQPGVLSSDLRYAPLTLATNLGYAPLPLKIGDPTSLGLVDSSFTATALVKRTGGGGEDQAIFGSRRLHLIVRD